MRRLIVLLTLAAVPLLAQDRVVSEEIVLSCGRCGDESTSVWDLPSCADEDLDEALRASALRGDRSAIDLLQRRYETAATFAQRYRIAEVLLNRLGDDRAIWREVESHAQRAVSFFDGTDEGKQRLQAYCDEKVYPVEDYELVAINYFAVAGTDGRSRPLLLRALRSKDISLVATAIAGFAAQKDESALPLIAKTMREWPDDDEKSQLALVLSEFRSEQADALALELTDDRELYFEFRNREGL